MALTGLQFINGLDAWETYGLAVSKGNADMLLFPERKESLSKNWVEQHGLDIDLSLPTFEAREVKLRCLLWGVDNTQWWARRNAFFAEMSKPGWQTWRVDDHDKDYSFYYRKASNPAVFTGTIKGVNGAGFTFDLELMVTDQLVAPTPVPSSEPVYIRDQNGNLLVTVQPGGTYMQESTDVFLNGVYLKSVPPGYKLYAETQYSIQFNIKL